MPHASDRKEQAEAAIRRAIEERDRALRDELGARWQAVVDDALAALPAPPSLDGVVLDGGSDGEDISGTLSRLAEALTGLTEANDQVSLLNGMVAATEGFAGRAALFLVRRDRAVGWTASGYPGADVRQIDLPLDGDSPLAQVVRTGQAVGPESAGRAQPVWDALGVSGSDEYLALPLQVKGRVAAVLFADGGDAPDSPALAPDALRIAVQFAQVRLAEFAARGGQAATRDRGTVERRPSQAWDSPPLATATAAAGSSGPAPGEPLAEDRSPGGDAADPHAEAKRFARLLVSEILLYNESQVAEGRQHGDLWSRLREDLERSEQMYRQRVPAEVAESVDYFEEEVVRTLANGDPALLGSR